jgi:hypothetical protein
MEINYRDNNLFILVNLFLFFSLIPFVSIYPIGADVQPMILLVGFVILVYVGVKYQYQYDYLDLIFLLIALLSLVYVNFNLGEFFIRKRIGLLSAFLIFYVARRYHFLFSFKVFYWGVVVNLIAALTHMLSGSLFRYTFGKFIRIVKILEYNPSVARGTAGWTPEPGFLGALCVYFLLLLVYFCNRQPIRRKYIFHVVIMALFMLIFSKSGTGFTFFLCFLFFWGMRYMKSLRNGLLFLIVFPVVSIPFLFIIPRVGGRGLNMLKVLFTNPQHFLVDGSVGHRLVNIWVSFCSLIEYPFGAGAGSFEIVTEAIFYKYHGEKFFAAVASKVKFSVSAFAQYNVELGLFFFIFLIIIFINTKISATSFLFRSIAFLFIFASFSILFPPTWILLAVTCRSNMSIFQKEGRAYFLPS